MSLGCDGRKASLLRGRFERRRERAHRAGETRVGARECSTTSERGSFGSPAPAPISMLPGRSEAHRERRDAQTRRDGSRDGRDPAADKGLDPFDFRAIERARRQCMDAAGRRQCRNPQRLAFALAIGRRREPAETILQQLLAVAPPGFAAYQHGVDRAVVESVEQRTREIRSLRRAAATGS